MGEQSRIPDYFRQQRRQRDDEHDTGVFDAYAPFRGTLEPPPKRAAREPTAAFMARREEEAAERRLQEIVLAPPSGGGGVMLVTPSVSEPILTELRTNPYLKAALLSGTPFAHWALQIRPEHSSVTIGFRVVVGTGHRGLYGPDGDTARFMGSNTALQVIQRFPLRGDVSRAQQTAVDVFVDTPLSRTMRPPADAQDPYTWTVSDETLYRTVLVFVLTELKVVAAATIPPSWQRSGELAARDDFVPTGDEFLLRVLQWKDAVRNIPADVWSSVQLVPAIPEMRTVLFTGPGMRLYPLETLVSIRFIEGYNTPTAGSVLSARILSAIEGGDDAALYVPRAIKMHLGVVGLHWDSDRDVWIGLVLQPDNSYMITMTAPRLIGEHTLHVGRLADDTLYLFALIDTAAYDNTTFVTSIPTLAPIAELGDPSAPFHELVTRVHRKILATFLGQWLGLRYGKPVYTPQPLPDTPWIGQIHYLPERRLSPLPPQPPSSTTSDLRPYTATLDLSTQGPGAIAAVSLVFPPIAHQRSRAAEIHVATLPLPPRAYRLSEQRRGPSTGRPRPTERGAFAVQPFVRATVAPLPVHS